jgi:hypothetical protein
MMPRKSLLAVAAAAALLAGCASDPYTYSDVYYDGAYRYDYPTYRYYSYAPGYYVAPPVVSFGLVYRDRYR